MKVHIIPAWCAGILAILAGCASSSDALLESSNDATFTAPQQAFVYVGGKERVEAPGTVRVRRSFGENEIDVRDMRGEVVRTYVVEMAPSSNQSELVYSYWGNYSEHMPTFFVRDLNRDRNGNIIIPYFPRDIAIRDERLDLTLLVGE